MPQIILETISKVKKNDVTGYKGGSSDSARYCYSVWLRHLVMAHENGMKIFPLSIAELGPGRSLGAGMAALISGVNHYTALEARLEQINSKRNIKIFDEIVALFRDREKIPGEIEFPQIKPLLENYDFPSYILTDTHMSNSLKPERLNLLRNILKRSKYGTNRGLKIKYSAPWYGSDVIEKDSIDMAFSQAVMEHVVNVSMTYEALYQWIKPGGLMSHKIDCRSHGYARDWNGHWEHSDLTWKLIHGRRSVTINREPHSVHINLTEKQGFNIVCNIQDKDYSGIQRNQLSSSFAFLSDDDLHTTGSFIQAIKPLS